MGAGISFAGPPACRIAAVLLLYSVLAAAGDAPDKSAGPTSPDQLRAWVAQLGSEDFEVRERSEAALLKAGPGAIPLLAKACDQGDAEVRLRARRVLDQLQWAVRPPVTDLADILPADTLFLVQAPHVKEAIARIRAQTVIGKLYDNPALATLKSGLGELLAHSLRMDAATRQMALNWLDTYGGCCGFSFIRADRNQPMEREQFAFVLGCNGPDPAKAYSEFAARFPFADPAAQVTRERYRGVELSYPAAEYSRDALARVTNLICRGSGPSALKTIVDGAAEPPANPLGKNPAYLDAIAKAAGDPLAVLWFKMAAAMRQALSPGERRDIGALGLDGLQFAAVTLSVQDGLFVERAAARLEGERKGLAKLLSLKRTTGRLAGLCPQDALAFLTVPLDAKLVYDAIMEVEDAVEPQWATAFREQLARAEQQAGVKIIAALLPTLQGEAAVWALRPAGVNPAAPPQLEAAFETRDAASAAALSEAAHRLLAALGPGPNFMGSAEYRGRKCYWLKPEAIDPDCPYTFSWCADGARVLVAGSQEGLQRLILRLEADRSVRPTASAAPVGLDANPDFKRLTAAIPEAERGGLAYFNTAGLLSWAYMVGLPLLTASAPDDAKGKFADAPKDLQAPLKDLPGTVFSLVGTPDGMQARALGGFPISGMVASLPLALVYHFEQRAVERRAEAQARMEGEARRIAAEEAKQAAELKAKRAAEAAARKDAPGK